MKTKFTIWLLIAAMAGLMACSKEDPEEPRTRTEPLVPGFTIVERQVADRMESMSYEMIEKFYGLAGEDRDIVILSPYSAQTNLSMLANGADGETLEEVRKLFNTPDIITLNGMHQTLRQLFLDTDPESIVKIANNIWLDNPYKAEEDFTTMIGYRYNAEVANVDLGSESARNTINSWISDATQGLIKDYLSAPLIGVPAFAVNAIYFNGTWTQSFSKDQIRKFHNMNGTDTARQFIDCSSIVGYGERENLYQTVELSFGNGSYLFTIFLPAEGVSIEDVLESLSATHGASDVIKDIKLHVSMPEFKVLQRAELSGLWSAMGYDNLVGDKTSYPGICGENLRFSKMEQALYLRVDEKGAEMAAVTGMVADSAMPIESVLVDRPFVFAIRSSQTGVMLVGGVVRNL